MSSTFYSALWYTSFARRLSGEWGFLPSLDRELTKAPWGTNVLPEGSSTGRVLDFTNVIDLELNISSKFRSDLG